MYKKLKEVGTRKFKAKGRVQASRQNIVTFEKRFFEKAILQKFMENQGRMRT